MSIVSGSLGAVMGANATTDAANTAAAASDRSLQTQREINSDTLKQQRQIYDEQIAREKPFYDTGVSANSNLDKMVNGGYDVKQSPAAQYELREGSKSLNRQLAARGLLGSGNAAQRLSELSSGVAANDYNQQYSRLLDQVKIGTGASASAGASSNTLGNQIGQNSSSLSNAVGQNSAALQNSIGQAGQARAALYSGMGGASAGAANAAINAYRSGLFNNAGSGAAADNGVLYGVGDASYPAAEYYAA